jgi:hypothetical protein
MITCLPFTGSLEDVCRVGGVRMPKIYVFDKETGQLIIPREGVLSWPSWRWQVAALTVSTISGLMLSLVPNLLASLIGVIILAISLYGGIRSKWLTKVDEISPTTKIICKISVIFGLTVIALLILSLVILILLLAVLAVGASSKK